MGKMWACGDTGCGYDNG